jgi:hypothetical protein
MPGFRIECVRTDDANQYLERPWKCRVNHEMLEFLGQTCNGVCCTNTVKQYDESIVRF